MVVFATSRPGALPGEFPLSSLMRLAQVASLDVILSTIWASGVPSTGMPQLRDFLVGSDPEPAPEAQGSSLGADGEIAITGPFRFSRHPSNLASMLLSSLFPRMTANRATLTALVTVYAAWALSTRSTGYGRRMALLTSGAIRAVPFWRLGYGKAGFADLARPQLAPRFATCYKCTG